MRAKHVGSTFLTPAEQAYFPSWFQEVTGEKKSAYLVNLIINFMKDIDRVRPKGMPWGVRGQKDLGCGWVKPSGLCASSFHSVPRPHCEAAINFCLAKGWTRVAMTKGGYDAYFVTEDGLKFCEQYEQQIPVEYRLPTYPEGVYYQDDEAGVRVRIEKIERDFESTHSDSMVFLSFPKDENTIKAIKVNKKTTGHSWSYGCWRIEATEPSVKAVIAAMAELGITGPVRDGLQNILDGKMLSNEDRGLVSDGIYHDNGDGDQVWVMNGRMTIHSGYDSLLIQAIKCCWKTTNHKWDGIHRAWEVNATRPSLKAILDTMVDLGYEGFLKGVLAGILDGTKKSFEKKVEESLDFVV